VAIISVFLLVGMLVISILLANSAPNSAGQSNVGIGITAFLLFIAAGSVGAGFGFLFGLPRSRFTDQLGMAPGDTPTSGTVTNQPPTSTRYVTNSNLIKVSDWLTTIIIGLGLVNLGHVIPAVGGLATVLKEPLGGATYAGTVGVSIVISAFLAGLLLFYLWTLIRVRELLEEADRQLDNVPSVKGLTVGQAKLVLGATPFVLVPPENAGDEAKIGIQDPAPGTIAPKGTDVTVNVMQRVPELRGATRSQAEQRLIMTRLRLQWPKDARDDPKIIDQNPPPGTEVLQGTKVAVTPEAPVNP
jgi:hypothetical protein